MKFSLLYEELKFSDVFSKASPEEIKDRQEKFADMKIKEILDNREKVKLPDGTWHILDYLYVTGVNLGDLKKLNVSIVDGDFDCQTCSLTSLEGGPKIVRGTYLCSYNNLINLKGAPEMVNSSFVCEHNKLKSLEGASEMKVGWDFNCSCNELTSLIGAPKIVKRDFWCILNSKKFTEDEVRSISNVKRDVHL